MNRPIVVAISGASGAPYAIRLVEVLLDLKHELHLTISPSGAEVIRQETGRSIQLNHFTLKDLLGFEHPQEGLCHYFRHDDFFAPMASGSFLTGGMVICPCSGTTLSAVAHTNAGNLMQRAAEVQLKEKRKLILVPRETPLSLGQINNLQKAAEYGAIILPASPGWYHGVEQLSDLVDFIVARILDQLGVEHQLMRRWGSS